MRFICKPNRWIMWSMSKIPYGSQTQNRLHSHHVELVQYCAFSSEAQTQDAVFVFCCRLVIFTVLAQGSEYWWIRLPLLVMVCVQPTVFLFLFKREKRLGRGQPLHMLEQSDVSQISGAQWVWHSPKQCIICALEYYSFAHIMLKSYFSHLLQLPTIS